MSIRWDRLENQRGRFFCKRFTPSPREPKTRPVATTIAAAQPRPIPLDVVAERLKRRARAKGEPA